MYKKLPNIVFGFHGCNRDTYEDVLFKGKPLRKSENSYDWLGHGIYFWEQNFLRARDWAKQRYGEENAYVIGAVIDLGYCLNLTDSFSSAYLVMGYELLKLRCEMANIPLPTNRPSKKTTDILLRDLDCAVIQQIHDCSQEVNGVEFDSVRGIFLEGPPPYPGSEFREKTHVQLCIRNPNCIKGYFSPLCPNKDYPMP